MTDSRRSGMAETTCWTLVRGAAEGDRMAREEFARLYQPVVRTFLSQRWAGKHKGLDVDDALQDVFVDCLRPDGALQRLDGGREGGFRGFLYGVVRNVARRHEERCQNRQRRDGELPEAGFESDATGAETAFDRAWAKAMMKEAARAMAAVAVSRDALPSAPAGRATRRVELLRLRFQQDRPIREIARQWEVDPAWLHHEYATAREEFRQALLQVIAFHNPQATSTSNEAMCRELLDALG